MEGSHIMAIITAAPQGTAELLNTRVATALDKLQNHFEAMDGRDPDEWEKVIDLKDDLVNAQFARGQLFTITHHLAKTILSST
jgi:hypothetical protein